jgi:hypothetical protein
VGFISCLLFITSYILFKKPRCHKKKRANPARFRPLISYLLLLIYYLLSNPRGAEIVAATPAGRAGAAHVANLQAASGAAPAAPPYNTVRTGRGPVITPLPHVPAHVVQSKSIA